MLLLLGAVLAAALTIGLVAVADHNRKNHRLFQYGGPGWSCIHGRGRCAELRAVERRWTRREKWYEATLAMLGAASVLLAVVVIRSPRRHRRRTTQEPE
jgi:hypothetical protein